MTKRQDERPISQCSKATLAQRCLSSWILDSGWWHPAVTFPPTRYSKWCVPLTQNWVATVGNHITQPQKKNKYTYHTSQCCKTQLNPHLHAISERSDSLDLWLPTTQTPTKQWSHWYPFQAHLGSMEFSTCFCSWCNSNWSGLNWYSSHVRLKILPELTKMLHQSLFPKTN